MEGRLLRVVLLLGLSFPIFAFSQPFLGDTLWARDYSSTGAFSCAFSPDGTKLAVAYECMGPMVRVIEVNTGFILWESATPDLCLYSVQFSSNGQYIAIAEELGHLLVIDITIPDTIYNIDTQSGGLNTVDFSADNQFIYTGCDDGSIRIYETSTGMLHHTITGAHSDAVLSVDASSTDHYLASGGKDNKIKVWDLRNNYQLAYQWSEAMDDIKAVKFTPDENRLLAGGVDDMIYSYWMPTGELDTMLMFHMADVNTIDISADGSFAASGSNDQSIEMFNLHNYNSIIKITNQFQTRVYGVAISPQMDKLAAANHIGYVIMYNIQSLIGTEIIDQKSLHIYPNPATDFIMIDELYESAPYELINLNGSIIKAGITSGSIELSNLSKGIYLLHIGVNYIRIIKN